MGKRASYCWDRPWEEIMKSNKERNKQTETKHKSRRIKTTNTRKQSKKKKKKKKKKRTTQNKETGKIMPL